MRYLDSPCQIKRKQNLVGEKFLGNENFNVQLFLTEFKELGEGIGTENESEQTSYAKAKISNTSFDILQICIESVTDRQMEKWLNPFAR